MSTANVTSTSVVVTVELFGNAQLLVGRRVVDVDLSAPCTAGQIAESLAGQQPALVGSVIRPDQRGFLKSYTLNINGTQFVGDESIALKDGDSLLLFSSQAGG